MNERAPAIYRLCIVGDESSHTGHHYLVYGTVTFRETRREAIEKRLRAAVPPAPLDFERSWNDKRYLGLYINFVDAIMRSRNDHGLSFRCTVVDTHQARSPAYRTDDPDRSLERYIYHHLLGFARRSLAPETTRFVVTLDQSPLRRSADVQKITLNHAFKRDTNRDIDIFDSVVDGDSETDLFIQAADVLTGAVAWVWNKRGAKANASKHKRELAAHVAKRARLHPDRAVAQRGVKRGDVEALGIPTLPHHESHGFAIWHLDFSKSKWRAALR